MSELSSQGRSGGEARRLGKLTLPSPGRMVSKETDIRCRYGGADRVWGRDREVVRPAGRCQLKQSF